MDFRLQLGTLCVIFVLGFVILDRQRRRLGEQRATILTTIAGYGFIQPLILIVGFSLVPNNLPRSDDSKVVADFLLWLLILVPLLAGLVAWLLTIEPVGEKE